MLFAELAQGGSLQTVNTNGTITDIEQRPFDGGQITGLAPRPDGQGACYGITHMTYLGEREPDIMQCFGPGINSSSAMSVIGGALAGLALGADGKIWYTDARLNGIGRFDVNTFRFQASYLEPGTFLGLASITNGPDGALWFTAVSGNQIGRITTNSIGLKTIPTPNSQPAGIVAGPDGALWFTEFNANQIGRITPDGTITEFPLPTANAQPLGIAAGPDGALWFTENNANQIGRISVFGGITEYAIPTVNSQPAGIVAGPDGNMWFTEFQGNKIGRLTVTPAPFVSQSNCFLNWAERTFASFFAPAASLSNTLAPYYYRYYSQTNAFLATSSADSHVYYLGPLSGNSILDAGALSGWLATAGCP